MEVLKFGKEIAQEISNYNSISAFYSKLMKTESPTNIGFINIDKGGYVGYHKAPVAQLFLIVEGEGWVEGEDRNRVMVKKVKEYFGVKVKGILAEVKRD